MSLLNPDLILQPNRTIHADYAHTRGIFGTGVGVAVLDSGIKPRADFDGRIVHFEDFVHHRPLPYDDSGHGSHICGKIGSAGKILTNPDSSGQSEKPKPYEYLGIAPGCDLIVLKILDHEGNTSLSTFLQAVDWLMEYRTTYNIRIVNISLGADMHNPSLDTARLNQAVDMLWDCGYAVCVSAGNNGPSAGSITAPGSSCKVITVGASDDHVRIPGKALYYSGRGPAACTNVKPEIVAPGSQIISCSHYSYGYAIKTGTSMSTAFVSGAIALLLEILPHLTNEDIKKHLRKCSRRLSLPHFQQGYGLLDIKRLISDSGYL